MTRRRIGKYLLQDMGSVPFWAGIVLGCGLTMALVKLPAADQRSIASPLDQQPLVIRHDAKGDGRFAAPRSGGRRHRGVDLVAAPGSPVRAIRSGTVLQIGDHRGLGRYVELEHRHRLHSLYAHLDMVSVGVGDRIRQGQAIGTVGKTGNARHPGITPHLHLEVFKGSGQPLDPRTLGLLALDPVTPQGPSTAAEADESGESADAGGGE